MATTSDSLPPAFPPAPDAPRPTARRRRVALAFAAFALLALIALFDWNWFRPLIQRVVLERSGRHIAFEQLRIGLTDRLDPLVELRGLRIDNAAWADAQRPLVEAALLRFEFAWHSLDDERVSITRAVLVDARVNLERSADELRNWRLTRPLDRGPGHIRVLALDATRSSVRFVDHGSAFALNTEFTPLPAVQTLAAAPALPLTTRLRFDGARGAARFDGEAELSAAPTFSGTGRPFALRGQVRSAGATAKLEGQATDLFALGALDLAVQLDAPRLDRLRPLFPTLPWPALPFTGQARLARNAERTDLTTLQARLGRSDARGALHWVDRTGADSVPLLRADLRSATLQLDELEAAFAALPPRKEDAAARPLDADIAWQAARLSRAATPWIESLAVQAQWRRGRLALAPFDLGAAGGRLSGTLQIDTTASPNALTLDARASGVRLERLSSAAADALQGRLDGRATLRASGDSAAALLRSLAGSVVAGLQGGTVSRQLDARLALDGGALLRSWIGDPARVPVRCARVALDFERGRGTLRRLGFETERVALAGGGSVDLGQRALDLLLTPQRKASALLALDRSIRISGPLARPAVALTEPRRPVAAAACAEPRD